MSYYKEDTVGTRIRDGEVVRSKKTCGNEFGNI